MNSFENEFEPTDDAPSSAPGVPRQQTPFTGTISAPSDSRMDMGMALSTPDDAPKSRLGRAKRVLQQSNDPTKSTGPSFAGFQPVDDPGPGPFAPPLSTPPLSASLTSTPPTSSLTSTPPLSAAPFPSGSVTSTPPLSAPLTSTPPFSTPLPSGALTSTPPFSAPLPSGAQPSTPVTSTPPAFPNTASFTTDEDAFELTPQSAPTPSNPFSGEVASLDLPAVTSTVDDLPLPDLEAFTPAPTKDVSLEELRAILTGAPDRFENMQHATWDPIAAAAKQAEPSFESQTEKFRIAAANLAAVPPIDAETDAPADAPVLAGASAPATEAPVGAFATPRGPIADITAQPLPDLSGFERSTIDRVTKESKTPAKIMKKGRLAAVFAKQDVPNASFAESLSERSTKALRIAAGALLALGLLLVAFLQLRDDTPKPTIPAITVENTTPSVESPSGNPIDVPIAGQDSTSTIASGGDDDFFSEGEDFSFSEGEDFTVK